MTAGAVLVDQAPVREDAPAVVHLGFRDEDRSLCGQDGLQHLGAGWEPAVGEEVCVVCADLAATYRRTGVRP